MRILVCGDRNWVDKLLIKSVLRQLLSKNSIDYIIEGEARGADSLARECAEELGIKVLKFPADWKKYGKAAGPIRNQQMLKEGKPDLVLAFHDNLQNSKGTANMIKISKKAGIETEVYHH
ncbi:DUF2493 domain-containing protein [Candidatus Daviesbacteria bacterium]|nr:DUF2493 domain-containing protein [Candidatus Daviesbacteria bacterium]